MLDLVITLSHLFHAVVCMFCEVKMLFIIVLDDIILVVKYLMSTSHMQIFPVVKNRFRAV